MPQFKLGNALVLVCICLYLEQVPPSVSQFWLQDFKIKAQAHKKTTLEATVVYMYISILIWKSGSHIISM